MLYIFGAGHVAYSLYKIAAFAGFSVVVADDRVAYANRERFPDAQEVLAEDFDQVLSKTRLNSFSYMVIVTRGHKDDMRILRWALQPEQAEARYIGMIGSRRKVIAIQKELMKEGVVEKQFERVHSPVGLDIGAITPEEIAVAICAEMIAVRRNANSKLPHMSWFLRETASPEEEPANEVKTAPLEKRP